MENESYQTYIRTVRIGAATASDAYDQLKLAPFEDLGYAKVDHHREVRQGAPEVIYGASKTKEQMGGIINSLLSHIAKKISMIHKNFRRTPRTRRPYPKRL